jgi:hypothetical protein
MRGTVFARWFFGAQLLLSSDVLPNRSAVLQASPSQPRPRALIPNRLCPSVTRPRF